ncbi:hypothetical protein [Sphingorhabdus sp. M41]|uniref:hypothetical protein n=1 Tax=Sphingorhabdus sp. M41 TaxID=1806885 RepID=UPI00078C4D1C|nr:hypothetical protein [Sphingorhabdus sp. M41]AMO72525.1 hypothetical protein AZE99_12290 [Sphingorhabdus sp. M41]
MVDKRYFPLIAVLGLVAASVWPAMASDAQDVKNQQHAAWSETLASDIKAQVKLGSAEGAEGMEKGADKMLRGADEMEAYADRLENDSLSRAGEAVRQNERRNTEVTAQQLLESAPKLRLSAEKMREGAVKMRAGAEKMRRGDDS